jgi:hypothetical protein
VNIDYKSKCERLTAVIDEVLVLLCSEKLIDRSDVYDRLHAAIYSDQFDEEEPT